MSKWNRDPSKEVPSLKLWLTSNNSGVHNATEYLYSAFLSESDKPIRKPLVYKSAISVLLLNFATSRNSQGKLITKKIKLSKSGFPSPYHYINPHKIGKTIFFLVYDFFLSLGYINEALGSGSSKTYAGKLTNIQSTVSMIKIFNKYSIEQSVVDNYSKQPAITLKDINGKFDPCGFRELKPTKSFIERFVNVASKNTIEHPCFVTIYPHITRKFKPNLRSHGRFYGQWQLIPSKFKASTLNEYPSLKKYNLKVGDSVRKLTTINGKEIAEVDYKACFPFMLYHKLGLDYPYDDNDPYQIKCLFDGFSEKAQRSVTKIAFQCLLNGKSSPEKALVKSNKLGVMQGLFTGKGSEQKAKVVIEAIEIKHSLLQKAFNQKNPVGFELMYLESIIAMQVVSHFLEKQVICLPIHDSFLIEAQYAEELELIMKNKYHDKLNFYPVVKRDY
jgi:hypothetical protein